MHAVHCEILSVCKDRTRRGVATHSVAVQLLDFQPLLLDLPDEPTAEAAASQNGRICTFVDEPARIQSLLSQARHG